MPEWKYTNKSVTKEEAEKSLAAVKSACFKCEKHGSSCPISKTAGEIKAMLEQHSRTAQIPHANQESLK